MTSAELRELADALSIPTAYTYGPTDSQRKKISAYLRACADAMEAGPVAWRYWNEKSKSWNETSSAAVARAMQEGGRAVKPLYPVAMPALRMPEPMKDDDLNNLMEHHIWNNCTSRDLIRSTEAEVLRRVKEANE